MSEETIKLKKMMMNNTENQNVTEDEKIDTSIQALPGEKPLSDASIDKKSTDIEKVVPSPAVVKEAPKGIKNNKIQKRKPPVSKRALEEARMLRIRCKQICVSAFFQGSSPVHSLGFTSAIHGEGKSFLARLAAEVMAEDDGTPVTLLECNWEHPDFATAFHLPPGPGLAEWLSGDCNLAAVRHEVVHNLTVIPAGNSKNNPIGLLRALQRRGALDALIRPDELLIVDLPAITTTAYGQLAAGLVDALIIVVRMGITPEGFITETEHLLKGLPVHGVIFNQTTSHVPGWLRQLM